jgi:hypothetical protein
MPSTGNGALRRRDAGLRKVVGSLARLYTRQALPKPNLVYFLWRFAANGLRSWRAATSRRVSRDVAMIARELRTEGIVVGPSDRYLTDEGREALDVAARRVLEASRGDEVKAVMCGTTREDRKKNFMVHLASYPEGIRVDDALLKVALDQKLLEIVSSYLGLWPCLFSVAAWLNYPTDDPPQVSQLWHRDPEDLRLVKAFIYLVDVDERCGPFTYIPRTHPFGSETATRHRVEDKKRISDDRMVQTFPPASWRVCTGSANTMILADTLGYHRGGKPEVGNRILITFTYTSGLPIAERPLSVCGLPTWISSDIQWWAVEPLLDDGTALEYKSRQKNKLGRLLTRNQGNGQREATKKAPADR